MTYHVKFHSSIILSRDPNNQNGLVHQKTPPPSHFRGGGGAAMSKIDSIALKLCKSYYFDVCWYFMLE